jgi:molecular chaperone DnaK (HSP70)
LSSNAHTLHRLRERAKRTLSSATQTTIEIDILFKVIDCCTSLTHPRFEALCQDVSRSTLEPIEKVPRDSKINKSFWSASTHIYRLPHFHSTVMETTTSTTKEPTLTTG